MSHPPDYCAGMKRNIQPVAPLSRQSTGASGESQKGRVSLKVSTANRPESGKTPVESGLLGLCHEIAGLILRRHLEKIDAVSVRREVRERLVGMMSCSRERAERLIDLSLELIHVKAHGHFKRSPIELSLLIALAGDRLRDVTDN